MMGIATAIFWDEHINFDIWRKMIFLHLMCSVLWCNEFLNFHLSKIVHLFLPDISLITEHRQKYKYMGYLHTLFFRLQYAVSFACMHYHVCIYIYMHYLQTFSFHCSSWCPYNGSSFSYLLSSTFGSHRISYNYYC